MSIQRSYTMHYRNSTKTNMSLTSQPFYSLYSGVFLSGSEAKYYGDIFRSQGLSFPVEGVAGAKEHLARNVERAREIGDTLGMHAALLPLALLSGVIEGGASAGQAAVDVSRVTKSAAARHRSLRNWCDSTLFILGLLAEWAQASRPILRWEEASPVDDDSEAGENDGHWNRKTRCRSSKELLQTWLRTAHLLFWGWRCDVLRYLDEDRHSDVAVVKNKVRSWIEEISSAAGMGLQLPTMRWHDHGRTIADGKGAFLDATALARQRLTSLSAWLHCLDLSLAWDAAKVCDRAHAHHLEEQNKSDDVAPQGGWPNLLGFQLSAGSGGQAQGKASSLPTTASLLQLQRCWLDDMVATTHIRDMEADQKNGKRRPRRRGKSTAASTAAAVEAAVANGIRYVPAPAAPDSTKVPEGLDVRQAVVETLREDKVPEAFAHEITLMKYAADNRIDKSMHTSINELLTSVLAPNPFPVLTDALAVSSMSLVLRRTVDSQDSIAPAVLKFVGGEGENSQVFVARGMQKGAHVYGSKPALTDVDVEAALSLFKLLPPVAGWVLDELGDNCADVDVGIFGCPQQHGSFVHNVVPSGLTVFLACTCDFDLDSGETPMEHFTRCAVRCATAAHKKSALLVTGLTARTRFESNATPPPEGPAGGERFLLQQVLNEPDEVEDELAYLDPEEIVLEALMPYPIPTGGEVLVPISISFLLSETGDDGGCSEALVAAMYYNCVFSTAHAAENVAARHAVLTEDFDLPESHVKRTRRQVLESLDSRDFLEAYRLVHYLRCLRLAVPDDDDDDEGIPSTPDSEEADSSHREEYEAISGRRAWKVPLSSGAAGSESVAGVTAALKRMIKGPAGRLHHARRLLGVLRKVVVRESLAPETLALLDGRSIREHAGYCISYLLDAFMEQPLVRFEGAIQSIKLRARLLLDRVTEMTATEGPGEAAARPTTDGEGPDATQEAACDLVGAVVSMLEIVQLAVESDTHRCCPEIDPVLERFRRIENRTGKGKGNKPAGVGGRRGRRAATASPGDSSKSPKARKSSRTRCVRFG